MALQFGTDGVRGLANAELTPELALALGRVASRVLGGPFVVGADTRRSGPLLQSALVAGLAAEGSDVALLGVVPTPVVAFAAQSKGWAGAMVSASHNRFEDNGIKLFAPGGVKLDDEREEHIERELADLWRTRDTGGAPTGRGVGWIGPDLDVEEAYLAHLEEAIDGRGLHGVHVVIDVAHGAAVVLAAKALQRAGATVAVINDRPDGYNINERSGATNPASLRTAVLAAGAQVGLAFDGDADRLIAIDHAGEVVDGDHLIAICALDRHRRGVLRNDTVVTTVMANLGFRLSMERAGIHVVETAVGDRYVLEALDEGGHVLGGEQSGHVIFRDLATTGDGLLTGLVLLDVVHRSGRTLADLAADAMTRMPQVLLNVRVAGRPSLLVEAVAGEVAAARERLGGQGRILVRASGTEPLVRVMVEASTHEQAAEVAEALVAAVQRST